MISNVSLNVGDSGLNFLYIFFAFWALLIIVGVFLQFYEWGFRPGNFRKRARDLIHDYTHKLEHKTHRRHRV